MPCNGILFYVRVPNYKKLKYLFMVRRSDNYSDQTTNKLLIHIFIFLFFRTRTTFCESFITIRKTLRERFGSMIVFKMFILKFC